MLPSHPHAPQIENAMGPKAPWSLGPQYLVSNSELLWSEFKAFCSEPAGSRGSFWGSCFSENYGLTGERERDSEREHVHVVPHMRKVAGVQIT